MGMTQPKRFMQQQPIGANTSPNGLLQQSQAATPFPGNSFMPLIQDQIPYVQSPNAVPSQPTTQQTSAIYRKYDPQDNGFDPFQQNYRTY